MTCNRHIFLGLCLALATFGSLAVSSAQAAEFHCSVEPCRVTMRPDGTGKTAHHVISFTNGKETIQTTCAAVTGEGTVSTKLSSEVTMGSIKGESCTLNGAASTLTSNGCNYVLRSAGTLTITCPTGKEIENSGLGCEYNIPPQGPLTGVSYHSISSTEVTAELNVKKLTVNAVGETCPWGTVGAEFVTANVLLTGETDPGGVMENFWWE